MDWLWIIGAIAATALLALGEWTVRQSRRAEREKLLRQANELVPAQHWEWWLDDQR